MESKANDLRSLQVVFKALLAGQLIFFTIIFFIVNAGFSSIKSREAGKIFLLFVIVLAIASKAASYILFRKRLEIIKQENNFNMKLEGYRAASIMRMALAEGPALFAIVSYFVTGNHAFLIVIGLLVINFLSLSPSKDKLVQQMELNSEEEAQLI